MGDSSHNSTDKIRLKYRLYTNSSIFYKWSSISRPLKDNNYQSNVTCNAI